MKNEIKNEKIRENYQQGMTYKPAKRSRFTFVKWDEISPLGGSYSVLASHNF